MNKDRELKKIKDILAELNEDGNTNKAISQIKALVIESLGEEQSLTQHLHPFDEYFLKGYNQHIVEMKKKWQS